MLKKGGIGIKEVIIFVAVFILVFVLATVLKEIIAKANSGTTDIGEEVIDKTEYEVAKAQCDNLCGTCCATSDKSREEASLECNGLLSNQRIVLRGEETFCSSEFECSC